MAVAQAGQAAMSALECEKQAMVAAKGCQDECKKDCQSFAQACEKQACKQPCGQGPSCKGPSGTCGKRACGVRAMLQKADKMAQNSGAAKKRAHQAAAEASAIMRASNEACQSREQKLQAEDMAIQAAAVLAAEKEKVAKSEAVKDADREAEEVRKLASLAESDASDATFLVKKAQELQQHVDAVKRKVAAEEAKKIAERAVNAAVDHKNAAANASAARKTEVSANAELQAATMQWAQAEDESRQAEAARDSMMQRWDAYSQAEEQSWKNRGDTKLAQQSAVAAAWMSASRTAESMAADGELQRALAAKDYYEKALPARASLRQAEAKQHAVATAKQAQATAKAAAYNDFYASSIAAQANTIASQAQLEAQKVQNVHLNMAREWEQRRIMLEKQKASRQAMRAESDARDARQKAAMDEMIKQRAIQEENMKKRRDDRDAREAALQKKEADDIAIP